MRSIVSGCTAVALAAAVTVFCPGTASAAARANKVLRLRQDVPVTATGSGPCPGAATGRDGWHFIVRNHPRRVAFVSVSVTFDPGGTQTITSFPGQTDAIVFFDRGANLIGATAVVEGGLLRLLRLSHFDLVETCEGQVPPPVVRSPAPVPQAAPSPSPSPSPSRSPSPSPSPRRSVSAKPSKSTASASPSESVTPSASPDVTSSVDDQPQIQLHGGSTMVADVREEQAGLGFPAFVLIATAMFLVLFGGSSTLIMVRRRKVNAWTSEPPGTGPSPLP